MTRKRGPYAIRAAKGTVFLLEYHDGYWTFLTRQFAYWILEYRVETWREDE